MPRPRGPAGSRTTPPRERLAAAVQSSRNPSTSSVSSSPEEVAQHVVGDAPDEETIVLGVAWSMVEAAPPEYPERQFRPLAARRRRIPDLALASPPNVPASLTRGIPNAARACAEPRRADLP